MCFFKYDFFNLCLNSDFKDYLNQLWPAFEISWTHHCKQLFLSIDVENCCDLTQVDSLPAKFQITALAELKWLPLISVLRLRPEGNISPKAIIGKYRRMTIKTAWHNLCRLDCTNRMSFKMFCLNKRIRSVLTNKKIFIISLA